MRRWCALGLLCLAFFVDTLGSVTVFAAGPAMERALGLSQAGLQWSFTAATLPGGALLLAGGRLSDVFGRRRMFMLGVTLLSLASLAAGSASSAAVLIGARAVQGLAAGLLVPAALSLVVCTFSQPDERSRALAVWSAVGGAGGTAGLLLGGLMTVSLGWQWIFFINVPIGGAMLLLSPILLREPESGGEEARRIDVPGTVTITCAVAALVSAITALSEQGWRSPRTLVEVGAAVALGAVFVRIESRTEFPMLPPSLLRSRRLIAGNLYLLTAGLAVDGMIFILALYTQRVLGYSPMQFGGLTAIMTVTSVAIAPVVQRVAARAGATTTGSTGLALICIASLGLAATTKVHGFPVAIAGSMLVFGLGMGSAFVSGTIASLENVPEQDAGIAAGIQTISFSLGTTLGLAILSGISAAVIRSASSVGSRPGADLVTGYRTAFVCAAALAAVGLVVSSAVIRARRRNQVAVEPPPE